MSALMAERHDVGRQESLFEGLAAPRPNPWARPPDAPARDDRPARPEPEPEQERTSAETAVDASDDVAVDAPQRVAGDPQALQGETVRPPETLAADITIERRTAPVREVSARLSDAGTLAGPTLDDVVSRVWEGLATGLPAACPLCHGEVVPALGGSLSGSCTSCGMTID
jgi:hypothetical protein